MFLINFRKVDDGLPLRKVALTCVETVLEMVPEYVQAETFLPRLVILLSDKVQYSKVISLILFLTIITIVQLIV